MTTAMLLNTINVLSYSHQWGDLLQNKWLTILDIIGDDSRTMWIIMPSLVALVTYWFYAGIFTLIDLTGKPQLLRKYKIQPGVNEPVDRHKLWKAVKQVLFNQLIITPSFLFICHEMNTLDLTVVRTLPSLQKSVLDLSLMSMAEEALFYYTHRALHHRTIYKYVHKKHHEWTSPVAIITLYCHPLEHIFSNVGPIVVLTILFRPHVINMWIFIIIAIINSTTDHSGYSFPFSAKSVRFHDLHHARFNYNFGVLGWLDKLHGTYRES